MVLNSDKYSFADFVQVKSPDLFEKTHAFFQVTSDLRKKGYEQIYLRHVVSRNGGRARVRDEQGEHDVVLMCSSDYLGMSTHPKVKAASMAAVQHYGTSVSSVPLIAGTTDLHKELEQEWIKFKGVEGAVVFPTGQSANQGIISTLVGNADWVVVDKQVHHSIIEGVWLSRCNLSSFRHSDVDHLQKVLSRIRGKHPKSGILVVIEGVYGIDGDVPPVEALIQTCRQFDARIMVDDCHATGILGSHGEGTTGVVSSENSPDIVMDSLGKTMGSMGGIVGTTKHVSEFMRYFAKSVSFSVGLCPASTAAALEALRLMTESPIYVQRLNENASYMREGLLSIGAQNAEKSGSCIMSLIVGEELKLRQVCKELFQAGLWVEGLPFPAVSSGQERVRIRVTTVHSREDLDVALQALERVLGAHHLLQGDLAHKVCFTNNSDVATSNNVSIVTQRTEYEEVARFLWKRESQSDEGVAWYSIDEKVRYLMGQYVYQKRNVESRTFVVRINGSIEATATAFLDKCMVKNGGMPLGFIGCLGVTLKNDAAGQEVLREAVDFLRCANVSTICAPVDAPMVIFGGGLIQQGKKDITPFFQPYYDVSYTSILAELGFISKVIHPYFKFNLSSDLPLLSSDMSNRNISIRTLKKFEWFNEAALICEIMNDCFPRLGHFSGFEQDEWEDFVRGFMGIIFSDFWLIAEVDGKPAGFVGGFPSYPEAVRAMGGEVGPADFEVLSDRFEKATQGAIVWLAVRPKYSKLNIGQKLLTTVLYNMQKRGYEQVSVTWEMADPDYSAAELVSKCGGLLMDYRLELMELSCK
jgi:glycine C-acetyltransferase